MFIDCCLKNKFMFAIFFVSYGMNSVDISKLRKIEQLSEFQNMTTDFMQKGSFVAEYRPLEGIYKGKVVKVFGSLHTTYENGIPFRMVRKLIDELPEESAIIYENASFLTQGLIGKQVDIQYIIDTAKAVYDPSFVQKIKALIKKPLCTEMAYIAYLGSKRNFHLVSGDLPYAETLQKFNDKGYTNEDIFCYGVALTAPSMGFSTFTKPIYNFILKNKIKKNFNITEDLPYEAIVEFYNFKKNNIMFFDHVYDRDQYALKILFETLSTHNTVVIAFGLWHWNLWQDVLSQYLGEPVVQYYDQFLKK